MIHEAGMHSHQRSCGQKPLQKCAANGVFAKAATQQAASIVYIMNLLSIALLCPHPDYAQQLADKAARLQTAVAGRRPG